MPQAGSFIPGWLVVPRLMEKQNEWNLHGVIKKKIMISF